ncbi:histidine kinase [Actinoplanes italicus]|nr:histidine kinase [Actinoplanes italicus]GIE31152.1 histidine kinase [Actinoplanes italicus]
MKRLVATVRCIVLLLLAVAGWAYALVLLIALTLVIPFPAASAGRVRLADLGRRLARDWAGAGLPDLPRTPPPVPQRRDDGWYSYGGTLYRSPRIPAWMSRIDHYSDDPEAVREWRWLALTPVTGGLALLLPPALIVLGAVAAATRPWGLLAAAAAVIAALLVAPRSLRWYGRSTRMMLLPSDRAPRPAGRISRAWTATWQLAGLAGLSLAAFGAAALSLVAILLSWGGLLPMVTTTTRPLTGIYRSRARQWFGVDLPSPYRPLPPPPQPEADGSYRVGRGLYDDRDVAISMQRYGWAGRDPATWRDLIWAFGAAVLAPLSFLPSILVALGFFGLTWQPLSWAPWGVPIGLFTGEWITPFYLWYGLEHVHVVPAWIPDWTSLLTGLVIALLGLLLAAPLARLHLWWDRAMLGPTAAAVLAGRVARLHTSRAVTVDAAAAELRRIERDLHDGAQARLIAVGLGLGAVARLIDTDPVRAKQLLTQAQETSATALAELRDLVRGIHPPVLAERGLTDAVRAIALDTPLPVTVDGELPGRLEPAVESAVYFAVCETLANAARVASHVILTMSHRDGRLRMVVTDDGPGGADPARGTGLAGIERRLGAFDGDLTLHSPPGGPTVVIMEVPCALSSPKTSTS